jgi:hypothetical protein
MNGLRCPGSHLKRVEKYTTAAGDFKGQAYKEFPGGLMSPHFWNGVTSKRKSFTKLEGTTDLRDSESIS